MVRRSLAVMFLWMEARLDALFGARWNPLYQLGPLGFFYYWVVTVTGVYVYIFFDTGTTEAYDSLEYLTHEQWYLGGVMRSLHRYASDGMVLMMVVHMLREFAYGRFRGPRWFTWVTGVPIAGFVIISGITGYWLVWDELAQYVAILSAEWLDWLGIFGEHIARNFLTPASLDDRFFTLLMFIHIVVPLLLLLVLWIHLQRITRPAINPNRGLAVGTFVMLLVLCLVQPVVSHAPADLASVPMRLELDWYYLAIYPLMEATSFGTAWATVGVVTLILFAVPWLPPRWKAKAAVVDLTNCNGCGRCEKDCPYDAVIMGRRSDDLPYDQQAVVDPNLCTSCGICTGACPTAIPFRRRSALVPGIELPDHSMAALRQEIEDKRLPPEAGPRVVVFGCDHGGSPPALEGVIFLQQPCIGAFPPAFIDYVLSRDVAEGVLVTGCREGACEYRFGNLWAEARLAGERDPRLRKRVARERLRTVWTSPLEGGRLRAEIEAFRAELREPVAGPGQDGRSAERPENRPEELASHA